MPDLQHREAGTPGDPAVLLVHGFPKSSHTWRKILPPLAAAGYTRSLPTSPGSATPSPIPRGRGSARSRRSSASERPLASAHRFEREIPGSELVVLEGTGHFVLDDAPDRYAEALLRWLTRVRPGTAR